MLTYSFDGTSPSSLYEHLYRCIKNDIFRGVIMPGDKLPSKRSLAKNLNVSTVTVEHAYAMLMDEGYIYSLPKKDIIFPIPETFSPFLELIPRNITCGRTKSRRHSCRPRNIRNIRSPRNSLTTVLLLPVRKWKTRRTSASSPISSATELIRIIFLFLPGCVSSAKRSVNVRMNS